MIKELSFKSTSDISDNICDFLLSIGSSGTVLDKDENDEVVSFNLTIKAYFDYDIDSNFIKNQIISYFNNLEKLGFNIISKEIIINDINNEGWENSYQEYFQPFEVGKNLVIKPIWHEYKNDNKVIIDFDPSSFFGVTPHPSTRLCLEELEYLFYDYNKKGLDGKKNINFLDLGVGSGILSLVVHKFGVKNITAIDIDEVAIRNATDNFLLNKIEAQLFLGEIDNCKEKYDFIAGNLLADTIIELSEKIKSKLNKNGYFIGAGITNLQEEKVITSLEKIGFLLENKRSYENWTLLRFKNIN
ncbi:MAG: 50S ribosomal protein L11 methyltransferase [Candidatus Sericytochromatia bacterium]